MMRGKAWWGRLLVLGALVAATAVGVSGTASAAVTRCMTQSASDGAKIVPGESGGQKTRSIIRQRAASPWDDWLWKGPEFECTRGRTCDYAWEKSHSVTTSWNVGGDISLGNASSPSKKWYNFVASVTAGYGRSTTISTTFNFTVHLVGGDVAVPVQIAVRRWTKGDYAGGWVRTDRGCKGGTTYEWNGNVTFGSWTRNLFEKEKFAYAVNGRIR